MEESAGDLPYELAQSHEESNKYMSSLENQFRSPLFVS
jgi:hypothetical protein